MEMEEALHVVLDRWSEFELAGEPEFAGAPHVISPSKVPLRFALERSPSLLAG